MAVVESRDCSRHFIFVLFSLFCGRANRLLRDDVTLKIHADSHGLTILVSLAAPNTRIVFFQVVHILKPFSSMRDLAWPSVKLFAPATGAPGFGGLFGELTAGVFASRLAGG